MSDFDALDVEMENFTLSVSEKIGPIYFRYDRRPIDRISFKGQILEIAIGNYLGEHPDRLVDGFTADEKPEGCGWMNQSVIKSITNHLGSVLVELEPA